MSSESTPAAVWEVKSEFLERTDGKLKENEARKEHVVKLCGGHEYLVMESVFSPDVFVGSEFVCLNVPGLMPEGGKRFLEVGSGCGCLVVETKLSHPEFEVTALDINPKAVENTLENARRHNVELQGVFQSDVFSALLSDSKIDPFKDGFDLIFWNYPFHHTEKPLEELSLLERAVRDPFYGHLRTYFKEARKLLNPNGGRLLLGFSVTMGLPEAMKAIALSEGWRMEELDIRSESHAFRIFEAKEVAATPVDVKDIPPAQLGEGSLWSPRLDKLLWIDILKAQVHLYDPKVGSDRLIQLPAEEKYVGTVVERESGGLVVALQFGLAHLDLETEKLTPLVKVHDVADVRFNDGKCDPAGRFWAGTMHEWGRPGHGTLYRFDSATSYQSVLSPVSISNGIVWSLDHKTLYYIDTLAFQVVAYDYDNDSGSLSLPSRRVVVDFHVTKQPGFPDGMTIDSQGCLWVAHWEGARVTRWDPSRLNTLLQTIITPGAFNVTSCAFAGPSYDELFITTAYENVDRARYPNAGCLFRTKIEGLKGTAPFTFKA